MTLFLPLLSALLHGCAAVRSRHSARLCVAAALLVFGACTRSQAPALASPRSHSYLYVWASDADSAHSDFLAVIDATPGHTRYGEIVATIPIEAKGTMAHHTEPQMPAGGILLANGFHANTTFQIDLRDPLRPRLASRLPIPAPFSHAHSFERLPDGGVLATYQYQGGRMDQPGGLVEYDAEGRVRRASSAMSGKDSAFVRPYSLAVSPALDRVITTGNDMHHASVSTVVQVWRLSDLALLHTIQLPAGPRGDENVNSYEPRVLADGRTVLVVTRNCGLYHLQGVDTDRPTAVLVHTFADTRCFVPAIIGRYWIQPLANKYAISVFDMASPVRPREVSRLELGSDHTPHWLAADTQGKRVVITGFRGLERRVLLAQFDSARGVLQLDEQFRSPGASASGISFDRDSWPHGRTGPAIPHGAVFSRGG